MRRRLTVLLLIGLVCIPRAAMACATCFGAAGAPQTNAMNMAILFLLSVIGTVLSLFATFFVYLMLRARIVAREAAETKGAGTMATGQLVEVNANE